jgi:hypothetical protein
MIHIESDYIYIYIYKGRETLRRITGDHRRVGCFGILNAKSVRKKKQLLYARRLRSKNHPQVGLLVFPFTILGTKN